MIAGHFYPDSNANATILHRLATYFANEGHSVTVVRIVDRSEPFEELVQQGLTILRIPVDQRSLKTKVRLLFREGKMLLGILHAALHLYTVFLTRVFSADPFLLQYALSARILIRSARRLSTDVVVTACDPFWTHTFGLLLKRWCRVGWVTYMLDPYFDNPTRDPSNTAVARRLAEEDRMLTAADGVVATPGIYSSYLRSPLRRHINKVTPLELPMIRDLTVGDDVPVPIDQNYLNCTFVGHLYPELRDPTFVLGVFQALTDPRIRLNLIGGVFGEFPHGYLEAIAEPLGNRVVFHPTVDPDTAVACIRKSNVLVHIGNRGTDMFPSKFFDYCSTGRPIINFHWSDDCPTLPYARAYGLCLNVAMDEGFNGSIAREVEAFITQNASMEMTYQAVLENLGCRTSDAISADFLKVLASSRRHQGRPGHEE